MNIAITGEGIISAIGTNKEEVLQSLLAHKSGIKEMQFLQSVHHELPVGEVALSNEQMKKRLGIPEKQLMSRTELMGILAIRQALEDAGIDLSSVSASNKKIVTVNKKGVIKAGKKNGTAKITVTLASGKKATLKVKVQSPRVNTTKIKGLKSKVSLKKGEKLTLKPAIRPLTSQDKVTYTSSNKKVATVSKKGVITAKKKGTVKITVKSGKKSYVIKVKVK